MAVFGLKVYHMVKKLVLSVITAIYMDFFLHDPEFFILFIFYCIVSNTFFKNYVYCGNIG